MNGAEMISMASVAAAEPPKSVAEHSTVAERRKEDEEDEQDYGKMMADVVDLQGRKGSLRPSRVNAGLQYRVRYNRIS